MRSIRILLWLSAFANAAPYAYSQQWDNVYLKGETAAQISTCNAFISYTNAMFTVRMYGSELDFLYFRDDFTLPYNQVLGAVSMDFVGGSFLVLGSTNERRSTDILDTTQTLFLSPREEDIRAILDGLRLGQAFQLSFPNGKAYSFSLNGSAAAIERAINCYNSMPTGPVENNPFSHNPAPAPNNPFDQPNRSTPPNIEPRPTREQPL